MKVARVSWRTIPDLLRREGFVFDSITAKKGLSICQTRVRKKRSAPVRLQPTSCAPTSVDWATRSEPDEGMSSGIPAGQARVKKASASLSSVVAFLRSSFAVALLHAL